MNVLIAAYVLSVCPAAVSGSDAAGAPTADDVRIAIERGIDYLLRDQNSNGSWGGPQDSANSWILLLIRFLQ